MDQRSAGRRSVCGSERTAVQLPTVREQFVAVCRPFPTEKCPILENTLLCPRRTRLFAHLGLRMLQKLGFDWGPHLYGGYLRRVSIQRR